MTDLLAAESGAYFFLVTTSSAAFTDGPCHFVSEKNTAVYLPGGSGGAMSRTPCESLRQSGLQYLEPFGGCPRVLWEHAS